MSSIPIDPSSTASEPKANIAASGAKLPAAMQRRAQLTVRGGLHDGASAVLDADPIAVIGRSERCDVILREEGVALEHLAVMAKPDGIFVRALSEGFRANGQSIAAGDLIRLDTHLCIELGATDSTGKQLVQLHLSPIESTVTMAPVEPADSDLATTNVVPQKKRSTHKAAVALLSIGGLLAVIAGLASALSSRAADIVKPQAAVTALLASPAYAEVDAKETKNGWHFSGYVPTDIDKSTLARQIGTLTLYKNEVESGADLANRVRDELRMAGVVVKTSYTSSGIVTAELPAITNEKAEQVKAMVARDVPRAKLELKIVGGAPLAQGPQAPVCTISNVGVDAQKLLNNKNIVSIMHDAPAYIRTVDGTKYYEGGLLPNGATLVTINSESIDVQCEGITTQHKL